MRTEVNPKFVERAMKNQLGADIDSKKVLDLAKLVCDPKETQDIAEFFAGRLLGESSILKDAIYAKFVRENERFVSTEFEKILINDDSYITYCLCSNDKGATEDHILNIQGGKGIVALEKLRSKGMVEYINGAYSSVKKNFSYSFDYISKFISLLSKFYQPNNVGKERNYAYVITENLSRDGIKEWQAEFRRHHEALRTIRDNHKGEIDVFSVGFMDTFTSEDIDSKNYVKSKKDKIMNGTSKTLMSMLLFIFSLSFIADSQALELKPEYKKLLEKEMNIESEINESNIYLSSELVIELKGDLKKKLKNEFEYLEGKDQQIIKINEIDIIRAIEGRGKLELDSGTTFDGNEFNFRDYKPIRKVLVGGTDGGGG